MPTHNLYFRSATTLWFLVSCLLLASCVQKPVKVSEAERKAQDSIVSSISNLDSLVKLQKPLLGQNVGNALNAGVVEMLAGSGSPEGVIKSVTDALAKE